MAWVAQDFGKHCSPRLLTGSCGSAFSPRTVCKRGYHSHPTLKVCYFTSATFCAGEKALAVGAAASLAVLLSVAPADAGVTLEQPKLKNVRPSSGAETRDHSLLLSVHCIRLCLTAISMRATGTVLSYFAQAIATRTRHALSVS